MTIKILFFSVIENPKFKFFMEQVEANNIEIDKQLSKFNSLVEAMNILNNKLQSVKDYFIQVYRAYSNFIQNLTFLQNPINESEESNSPGYPNQIIRIITSILKTQKIIMNDSCEFCSSIDNYIIQSFQNILDSNVAFVKKTCDSINAKSAKKYVLEQTFHSSYSVLQQIIDLIENYHKIYLEATEKNETETAKTAKGNISSMSQSYKEAQAVYNSSAKDYTDFINDYLKLIVESQCRILATYASSLTTIAAALDSFSNIFSSSSNALEEIAQQLEQSPEWENDFTAFVAHNHIVRSSNPPNAFEPIKFSFEDDMLDFFDLSQKEFPTIFPVGMATITADYSTEQFSIKAGERVFTYNMLPPKTTKPPGNMVTVSNASRTQFSSVPIDILEEITGESVFIVQPNLIGLKVSSGEIAIKRGEQYESIRGEIGIIPTECIAHNKNLL